MNAAMLLLFGGTLLMPPSVSAPLEPGTETVSAITIPVALPELTAEPAPAQGRARASGGGTTINWRGQAGLFFVGGDTGFLLGGGGGAYPFTNKQVEVTGDLHFARISGENGVYGSGDGLYHFRTSNTNALPFAGAGLGFDHFSHNTDVNLQIVGGLDFNQRRPHPIRVDVRFLFTEGDTTTLLMLGVGFGK